MLKSTEFIKNTTHCPNIRLETIWFVFANFRTHIVGSSNHCHCMFIGVLKDSGYSKVSQLYCVISSQEYIGSLNISMQNFSAMDVFKSHAHLYKPIDDIIFIELFSSILLFLDMEIQITNFEKVNQRFQKTSDLPSQYSMIIIKIPFSI
jgi:hypothetical protein